MTPELWTLAARWNRNAGRERNCLENRKGEDGVW
jgi:hypothetical protein